MQHFAMLGYDCRSRWSAAVQAVQSTQMALAFSVKSTGRRDTAPKSGAKANHKFGILELK